MSRTESMSFQVHPRDEQSQIDLMQRFGWNLLSTQEIKTIDNHLERRGDTIYQVTYSEHYVKLAFTRNLDLPNLEDIKRFEKEYNSLSIPKPNYPKKYPTGGFIWFIICCVTYGIALIWWFISYKPKYEQEYKQREEEYSQAIMAMLAKKAEILSEVDKYILNTTITI